MNCIEVQDIFDAIPSIDQLREMFTPEQVRKWGDYIMEILHNSNRWNLIWTTDVLRWMIEEYGYTRMHLDSICRVSSVCSESLTRMRMMLKNGTVVSRDNLHFGCGVQINIGKRLDMVKLMIDYGGEPKPYMCQALGCHYRTYCNLAQSRRHCLRVVMALLSTRRKSPLARQYIARELMYAMARAVWARRWDPAWIPKGTNVQDLVL
ncbi:MAG: hypothetical protein ABIP54_01270 [Candidatus Andersenbacteria bacterium]